MSPTDQAPKTKYTPPMSNELAMKSISSFMSRNVIYAMPSTTVRTAIEMMITHKISGLAVVDDFGVCIGVYSELDAVLQGASQSLDEHIRFTKPALTAVVNDTFRNTLILIVKKKIKRVPIVDGSKKLVGIVSRRDLIKALFEEHKQK